MAIPPARRGAMLDFVRSHPEALAEQIVAFPTAWAGYRAGDGPTRHVASADELEPVFVRALGLCAPPFRPLELPEWTVEDAAGDQVVVVTVKPAPNVLRTACGAVFVRSGTLNVRLSPDQVVPAAQRPAPLAFEDQPVPGATLEDLDMEISAENQRNRVARGPRGEAFTQMELLRDAGPSTPRRPTAVGVLSCRRPEQFFPQVGVVLVRFRAPACARRRRRRAL